MRGISSGIKQPALSAFLIIVMLLAVVPAQAGNTPDGAVSNSSVSTYIVVFDNSSHYKEKAKQSASELAVTCGGHVKYRYKVIDGMAVELSDEAAEKLRKQPGVKYVERDREVHLLLDKAVPQIGADQAWASGYTGKGVRVCVIDTGVDANHPDLNGSKVVAWVDYVNGRTAPYDDHGHGTHVSSTIAGTGNASGGQYRGVAPEASLMVAKVLNYRGTGSVSNIVAAIDWATDNGAQVISMSLGSAVHDQPLDDAVTSAVESGVTVVVAAGNEGPDPGTISCPGDCEYAITVGAVDRNDTIADFSSRGPTYDNRVKPDIAGMGVGLVAAKAGGTSTSGYYKAMSGTSMATPMVAGVVALMLQKNASMTPVEVKSVLERTAKPSGGTVPNYVYGWGRVQASYAVDNVTTNIPMYSSSYVSDTFPGMMQSGQASAVSITLKNTGSYGWSLANNTYLMGSLDASEFGALSFDLPSGLVVRPGEEYTWPIALTAPSAEGPYNLCYQMSNGTGTFGFILNKTVLVKATVEPGTIRLHNTTYTVLRSAGKATIQVDRVDGLDNEVSVNYSTTGMTRTSPGYDGSGNDYVPVNGTLTFAQDQASATFNVTIQADSYYKGNMTIDLELSDVAGGASLGDSAAQLVVIDDAQRPAFEFSASEYRASKNQTNATIVVYCTNNYYLNASIDYTVGGGNATPGVDYLPASGTLNFTGRQASKSFNVTILDDGSQCPDKCINLALSVPTNGSVLGSPASAILVIHDAAPTITYDLAQGWNLISVPLSIPDSELTEFFPDNVMSGITDIWGWNESAQNFEYYNPDPADAYFEIYPRLTAIETGRAYWVNMNKTESFVIEGAVPASSPNSTVTIVNGWNFIGPTGLIASTPQDMYSGAVDIWGWNESAQNFEYYNPDPADAYFEIYPRLTTIKAGYGYWVNYPYQE